MLIHCFVSDSSEDSDDEEEGVADKRGKASSSFQSTKCRGGPNKRQGMSSKKPSHSKKNKSKGPEQTWEKVPEKDPAKETPVWDRELEFNEVDCPIYYFKHFFCDSVLNNIVEQSNLYSVQKNPNRPLGTNLKEIEQFLGICIYMSVYGLPCSRMYWENGTRIDKVADIMSRDRWQFIKSCIHLNDNSEMLPLNDPNRDKLFKVRPLLDKIKEKFIALPKPQMLSVDEQIVPFKGKSSLKQYNPKKPVKWGYKLFVLCDSSGLVHNFYFYTGNIPVVEGLPDLGASGNIVLMMSEVIPRNEKYLVYFDNWFASLRLFGVLSDLGIGALGTIRTDRFPDLTFSHDSVMKKIGRGCYEEVKTSVNGHEVRAIKWLDNRSVKLATTFDSAQPLDEVKRYDRTKKSEITIPIPHAVMTYNKFMGGVDLLDGLVAYYHIRIKSTKYYHRIFFHFVDMAIVNGWLMYRKDCEYQGLRKQWQQDLLGFRTGIAESLCKRGKSLEKKRGRPSSADSVDEAHEKLKKGPTKPIPKYTTRKDQMGHFGYWTEDRERCRYPGCKKLTFVKCNVHLCFCKQRNCFADFHR